MSSISIIETLIAGKTSTPQLDWQNNTISLLFGSDSPSPQVETDRLEFALDSAKAIIKHKGRIIFILIHIIKTHIN